MTLHGIDISNLQSFPPVYRDQAWYQAAQFVIVQALTPPLGYPGHGTDISAQQMRAARDDGKHVGVYVWLWHSFSGAALKADIAHRLSLVPDDVHLAMRPWLDVEDTTVGTVNDRRQDVLDALEVMDAWAAAHGLPAAGMYTGDWFISEYLGGWFPPGRKYWLANYGMAPSVTEDQPVHQYTSNPIDSDVMLESEIVSSMDPIPQDYKDKFGQDVTWQGVADNLEGIIHSLQDQLANTSDLAALKSKLDQIRGILDA